jgi:hypothetical protein
MGGNCLLSIEALNKTASSKSIGPCPAVMDSAFGRQKSDAYHSLPVLLGLTAGFSVCKVL